MKVFAEGLLSKALFYLHPAYISGYNHDDPGMGTLTIGTTFVFVGLSMFVWFIVWRDNVRRGKEGPDLDEPPPPDEKSG